MASKQNEFNVVRIKRMERIEVIGNLQHARQWHECPTDEVLDYVIASLKTDKAYQIMYEGGEIFTKADMVVMLEELQLEIEKLDSRAGYDGNGMPTFSTNYIRKKKANELIQQKINALKGEQA